MKYAKAKKNADGLWVLTVDNPSSQSPGRTRTMTAREGETLDDLAVRLDKVVPFDAIEIT